MLILSLATAVVSNRSAFRVHVAEMVSKILRAKFFEYLLKYF